ncbi:TSUP family transporter [Xylocopilactobacillus apicola]|uniref:TSUP family transporter n=1 Tax=Xylocopilactobacillus apicola TaxID=2932184 RepID=UPI003CE55E5B
MKTVLQILLGILGIYFAFIWIRDLVKHRDEINDGNVYIAGGIGFICNFFDALGIGSYAPTTMFLKLTKFLKSDKLLPGTLNVACSIPVLVEAFMFITSVKVDGLTLISLVIASAVGSFFGSKFIAKVDEKKIQIIMGFALVVTSILMLLQNTGVLAGLGNGNEATALTGGKLFIGIIGNLILGALMTAGIGLYAPCMAMIYLLGLTPIAAFPIMMASCAALMPVASREFIKKGDYNRMGSIGITIGGVIGVYVAVKFVKSLDVKVLSWLVIIVVAYTALTMLYQGFRKTAK